MRARRLLGDKCFHDLQWDLSKPVSVNSPLLHSIVLLILPAFLFAFLTSFHNSNSVLDVIRARTSCALKPTWLYYLIAST